MARVNPRTRGAWLAAASGQMLRQRPGARKNTRGSSGTRTCQKMRRAPAGRVTNATHMAISETTLSTRTPCHRERGILVGNWV